MLTSQLGMAANSRKRAPGSAAGLGAGGTAPSVGSPATTFSDNAVLASVRLHQLIRPRRSSRVAKEGAWAVEHPTCSPAIDPRPGQHGNLTMLPDRWPGEERSTPAHGRTLPAGRGPIDRQ